MSIKKPWFIRIRGKETWRLINFLRTPDLIAIVGIIGYLACLYRCGLSEQSRIEEVITRYNHALIDTYLRQDTDLLEKFTSPKEKDRVQQYIFFLLKKNQIIRCYLKELYFISIDIEDDSAIARTKERWSYEYLNAQTKEQLQPSEDIDYEVSYTMKRQGSLWIIDHLEVKEIEEKDAP